MTALHSLMQLTRRDFPAFHSLIYLQRWEVHSLFASVIQPPNHSAKNFVPPAVVRPIGDWLSAADTLSGRFLCLCVCPLLLSMLLMSLTQKWFRRTLIEGADARRRAMLVSPNGGRKRPQCNPFGRTYAHIRRSHRFAGHIKTNNWQTDIQLLQVYVCMHVCLYMCVYVCKSSATRQPLRFTNELMSPRRAATSDSFADYEARPSTSAAAECCRLHWAAVNNLAGNGVAY